MATARRTNLTLLAASAGLLLALTGCQAAAPVPSHTAKARTTHSATPDAGVQSKAAGCAKLQSSVQTMATDLQQSFASLAADPTAAEQKLKALTDGMAAGLDGVTNAEVKAAGTKAHDALAALDADITAVLANPKTADTAKIQADATAVQTTFTALGTVCG